MLTRMIRERRDNILKAYLPAVNPIVDPALTGDGRLTFRNAAVDAKVSAAPQGYHAVWFTFDNATSTTQPIGEVDAPSTSVQAPPLPNAPFIKVELSATGAVAEAWKRPLIVYFKRVQGGWSLVGVERLPAMIDLPGRP
jgi:hypothetical protein